LDTNTLLIISAPIVCLFIAIVLIAREQRDTTGALVFIAIAAAWTIIFSQTYFRVFYTLATIR